METMPSFVTAQTLKNFVRYKTPLYSTIASEYWEQGSLAGIRADYALFHCLFLSNYFRNAQSIGNDFGGGKALNVSNGVKQAFVALAKLNGQWLNLPAEQFEGMKKIEHEFLAFLGKDELPRSSLPALEPKPAPLPLPIPAQPPKEGLWGFVRSIAKVLGVLNGFLWLLKLWVPGPFIVAFEAVFKFVAELAAAHPIVATSALISSVAVTHAVALRIPTPNSWRRVDKSRD